MNLPALFISRPVATSLLTLGITLLGAVSFNLLPVSPLPQVDFPTIMVQASLPGASPETMASSVASPLERALGIIPGVTEMTSSSSLGSTNVVLQFDLSKNIDGAAREVQAAINAARSALPTGMPSMPTYRKINPADAPVLLIALTSDTYSRGEMYDVASTILAQKLAQVQGIGDVSVVGASLPAVRIEVNPSTLDKYGISAETLRAAIAATNAYLPKGALENSEKHWQIYANDLARTAADYRSLIVAWKNGAPIRVSDLADVQDSVEDVRNAGLTNGKPSVLILLTRQPGANIIETVDRVKALLPQLHAEIPAAINLDVISDRTPTIRASLHEVERALLVSVALVIMVVFLFLRNARATLIPSVTVPVSLIATFGVMYLAGFSLDNLSLMALVIATGFVVDDAVVVLENVSRHIEAGMPAFEAALKGAREVAFTVVSMSLSLIAVFIPILFMGGIIGRLFREFAITLSAAILVSLVVSLTLTPMMCARLLRKEKMPAFAEKKQSRILQIAERVFDAMLKGYRHSLGWALRHGPIVMLVLAVTIALNVYLYIAVPKGFFPQQDVGRMFGGIRGDQGISFQAMSDKLTQFVNIVRKDPAVENVSGSAGSSGHGGTSARMFVTLKPLGSGDGERTDSITTVMARIRKETAHVPGASLFLAPEQDIRIGGRSSNSEYQYTLQADSLDDLNTWGPRVLQTLSTVPEITDVDTDQQQTAPDIYMNVDRSTIARLGLTMNDVDAMLNNAFSQRQVSTIYNPMNQYHVVMEVAEPYRQSPEALDRAYVIASDGTQIPIASISERDFSTSPLAVNHQGLFSASTISFNLAPGVTLSQASAAIKKAVAELGMPVSVTGSFQGTAKAFQDSLKSEPLLILVAIVTVYLVLGMLYESYVHPLTILSTLPSAGIGALIGLWVFGSEFDIIGLIGILLLIGIVKKNAIMMIDAALAIERTENKTPEQAIYEACLRRFRPIMMTTMAAMLGAFPLAVPTLLGGGEGAEMRVPLGISVVCGLLLSQILTLYTTPVVYLYLDRFRLWTQHKLQSRHINRRRVGGRAENAGI